MLDIRAFSTKTTKNPSESEQRAIFDIRRCIRSSACCKSCQTSSMWHASSRYIQAEREIQSAEAEEQGGGREENQVEFFNIEKLNTPHELEGIMSNMNFFIEDNDVAAAPGCSQYNHKQMQDTSNPFLTSMHTRSHTHQMANSSMDITFFHFNPFPYIFLKRIKALLF